MYDLVLLVKLLPNLRRPGSRGPLWQGKNNAAVLQLDFSGNRKKKHQRRVGLVQLVSASSPSHQVLSSNPFLYRNSAGVRLCFGYSLPQTPFVWELLALGLPLFRKRNISNNMDCN
jgi:hypothetical protein